MVLEKPQNERTRGDKVEQYRNACSAYLNADDPPNLTELARRFDLHPIGIVEAAKKQDWANRRLVNLDIQRTQKALWRLEAARRVDLQMIADAERILCDASTGWKRLLALILALPDEPTPADLGKEKTDFARDRLRGRYLRRKVDLLADCTQGFTRMLSSACDAALITAPMRNKDDDGPGRLDFSKLTALQINIGAAVESVQKGLKQVAPLLEGAPTIETEKK